MRLKLSRRFGRNVFGEQVHPLVGGEVLLKKFEKGIDKSAEACYNRK